MCIINNKMRNKNNTIPSDQNVIAKSIPLPHMTTHSPGLVQSLSELGTVTLRAWYSHSPGLVQSLSGLSTVTPIKSVGVNKR